MDRIGHKTRPITSLGWLLVSLLATLFLPTPLKAAWIWVEGETPDKSAMSRHPWWYDKVKKDQLSGGDFLSNFDEKRAGLAEYRVVAPEAGEYEFWVRANPVQARLSYKINAGEWTAIDLDKDQSGNTNIADDGKPDLRFIAWSHAGKVSLRKGANVVLFRMDSKNSNHGYLDCFVFANEPFRPMGILKPGQLAAAASEAAEKDKGWFAFLPPADPYRPTSGIDLRSLNEKTAGDGGFIGVKGSEFVHSKTGEPVRFWAVNGPTGKDRDSLRADARALAKRGVNLVRVHAGYFDENGEVDLLKVKHAIEIVEAMKAEGIYTHFSIYFPLWFRPKADNPWLRGYDGKTVPFASLYFNKDFREHYLAWWKALLTTPSETTGKQLVDEPAVAGAELVNEDSYFFWTFTAANIPDPQLRLLEAQFGDWLKRRHGSLDAAFKKWGGPRDPRDRPAEGRVGFRPLWNIANERTARDMDTARFLAENQRDFYRETSKALRDLGFKGVLCASNWFTADPRVLGPLERYTYTACDFIDRHGYFGCATKGDSADWSVRDGQTYADRSALRFDSEEPGKGKAFVHPAMDLGYDGKPSMISETTWNRPNRYRSEAPLYYAAYGALQGTDAVVHFAMDTTSWSVKPGYFMQPWTLMSPAMMGQFPAAALIYRKGLVSPGEVLVDLNLKLKDLFDLKGTPFPQDANFDELRAKDVPRGTTLKPGNVVDPLVHYAGRTNVNFTESGGPANLKDLSQLIDRKRQTVASVTGQLRLDYGKGVLAIDAPSAQGLTGSLREAGPVDLKDLAISSRMELGHIVAVSLDDRPLSSSRKILLQVMSEEKSAGFKTEPLGPLKKIVSIGQDPWMVREFEGVVRFKRPDASRLRVTALDANGDPSGRIGSADEIRLRAETLYYLVTP
jgi:hypothetical protein